MPNTAKSKTVYPKFRILFVPAESIERQDRLSNRTLLRCKKALELWRTGKYDLVIVSGGKFLAPDVQTLPAGLLMGRWFMNQGLETGQLIIEQESLDTFENISFSVTAMRARGLDDPSRWDITVVSQWQHTRRFAISFRHMSGVEVRTADPGYGLGPIEWLKEWLFILVHVLDPLGHGQLARHNREQRRLAAAGQ